MRVVIDTSVLVSAVLFEQSPPRSVLRQTMLLYTPLVSDELIREYQRVMSGSKFDAYTPRGKRLALLVAYIRAATHVEISGTLSVCRDPRDDMVVETALIGKAEVLVTGYDDILALRPIPGVAIMTPKEFVQKYLETRD